jgi:hypothetical protein
MKTGRDLNAVAEELLRQANSKEDFLTPTTKLRMEPVHKEDEVIIPELVVEGHGSHGIRSIGHEHISQHTGIHKKYYDTMLYKAPELLATNVNHWFNAQPDSRMVRTLDGNVRAMLSPKYRILDNFDLFAFIFEDLKSYQGSLVVASSEITEERFYLKFLYPEYSRSVKEVGDMHSAGVIISNSEVGRGRIQVRPYIYRLVCKNGMIAADASLRKNHVGRTLDDFDEAQKYFADETRRADDRAFFMKVRDVFRATLTGEVFDNQIRLLESAKEEEITGNLEGAVEVLSNKFLFNEGERAKVMEHFIRDNDFSKFGIANAITRTAEDIESYDRATQFEQIGGEVIVMPSNEWRTIANASEPGEKKRRGRKPREAAA